MKRFLTIAGLSIGGLLSVALVFIFAREIFRDSGLNPLFFAFSLFFGLVGAGQYFVLHWIYVKGESIRFRVPPPFSRLANVILVCVLLLLIVAWIDIEHLR